VLANRKSPRLSAFPPDPLSSLYLRICPLDFADSPSYYCRYARFGFVSNGSAGARCAALAGECAGRAFGALLYTGPATVPFGDRLAAIPLQGLWSGA